MITPDKFMNCAKRIVSNSSVPEEDSRSAISRAYYSLYHETLQILKRKYSNNLINNIRKHKKRLKPYERVQLNSLDPVFLRKCNLHRIVPETLEDINERALAHIFKNFRKQRNQADYDLNLNFSQNTAKTLVESMENTIPHMKAL